MSNEWQDFFESGSFIENEKDHESGVVDEKLVKNRTLRSSLKWASNYKNELESYEPLPHENKKGNENFSHRFFPFIYSIVRSQLTTQLPTDVSKASKNNYSGDIKQVRNFK